MFTSARIKLTAWYLTIIMLISFMFSAAIYEFLTMEVTRFARMQRYRIEHQFDEYFLFPAFTPAPSFHDLEVYDPDLVTETTHRILYALVIINGFIFVASGLSGYWLAGRTLSPIKDMVDEQHRFISDASHELKTPLTSLKSVFEVYLRNKKRKLKDADTIIKESITEVDKLHTLSQSLLDLTQYQEPNGSLTFEHVSMKDIITSAMGDVASLAQKKYITMTNTLQDTQVVGDKYSLRNLFVILLDNAIKYSNEKSEVSLTGSIKEKKVVIKIADAGIGIDKKDLPHIFDRFYRADTARSKSYKGGYGLGLSIAKKIVDIHHGTIHVTSRKNIGSTFTIVLPKNARFS